MQEIIRDRIPGIAQKNRNDEWWIKTKMSDDFLEPVFRDFYKKIDSVVLMDKSRHDKLAELSHLQELDIEISEKLDIILYTAQKAEKLLDH